MKYSWKCIKSIGSTEMHVFRTTPDILTIKDNPDEGDWNLESELQSISPAADQRPTFPLGFPYHIATMNDLDSLNVVMNFDNDDWFWNYHCEEPITKVFKVFLHRPDEMKLAFDRPIELEVGRKVTVTIEPQVITTSDFLRKYNPKLRQCFFNSERTLRFYRIYTKSNCDHECLANFTAAECGCVKFSMPRE